MASIYADNARHLPVSPLLRLNIESFITLLAAAFSRTVTDSNLIVFLHEGSNFDKRATETAGGNDKNAYPRLGVQIMSIDQPDERAYNEKALYRQGVVGRIVEGSSAEILHPIQVEVAFTARFVSRDIKEFLRFAEAYSFLRSQDKLSFKLMLKKAETDTEYKVPSFDSKVKLPTTSVTIPSITEEDQGTRGETEVEFRLRCWIGKVGNEKLLENINVQFPSELREEMKYAVQSNA